MTNIPFAICPRCQHYRMRPSPELFSQAELQNPGVLQAKIKWDEQEQERRLAEQQLFTAGLPFNYEPHHYAWCAASTPYDNQLVAAVYGALEKYEKPSEGREEARAIATKSVETGNELIRRAQVDYDIEALQELGAHGRAKVNPTTGEIMPIYMLCAHMNPTGQCPLFEPKKRASEEVKP